MRTERDFTAAPRITPVVAAMAPGYGENATPCQTPTQLPHPDAESIRRQLKELDRADQINAQARVQLLRQRATAL